MRSGPGLSLYRLICAVECAPMIKLEHFLAANQIPLCRKTLYAARMLERKASISERRTSASRRSAPDAFSTSLAAARASVEAVLTPTMLLETSEVPPAAC